VDIVAAVTGTGARPLSGVPVSFSTTAGTLSPSRDVTDANGEARTRLTTDANATVTASAGTKATDPGLTITALNPVATPTVSLTAAPGTATTVAQLWTFTAEVENNAAVGSPVQFEWSFGDGSTASGTSPTITHAYTQSGQVYTARVVVRFANGTSISAQTDIVTKFP
jgi:hypothetical protein